MGLLMKRLLFALVVLALLAIPAVSNASSHKTFKPHAIKGYTVHYNFFTHKSHWQMSVACDRIQPITTKKKRTNKWH